MIIWQQDQAKDKVCRGRVKCIACKTQRYRTVSKTRVTCKAIPWTMRHDNLYIFIYKSYNMSRFQLNGLTHITIQGL